MRPRCWLSARPAGTGYRRAATYMRRGVGVSTRLKAALLLYLLGLCNDPLQLQEHNDHVSAKQPIKNTGSSNLSLCMKHGTGKTVTGIHSMVDVVRERDEKYQRKRNRVSHRYYIICILLINISLHMTSIFQNIEYLNIKIIE